jgi:hypothetical protein
MNNNKIEGWKEGKKDRMVGRKDWGREKACKCKTRWMGWPQRGTNERQSKESPTL